MRNLMIGVLLLTLLSLNSCAIIGGIFKAGIFIGVLAVVVIIILILGVFSMFRRK